MLQSAAKLNSFYAFQNLKSQGEAAFSSLHRKGFSLTEDIWKIPKQKGI